MDPNNSGNINFVGSQSEWGVVGNELESENLKLVSYDKTLLEELGGVRGKKILDYGAGPGVLAKVLKDSGADVKVYDISPEMRRKAEFKIGEENVYSAPENIPKNYFDIIICNLVLCIVPEEEEKSIVHNLEQFVKTDGVVYIGFCNPKIHNVPESQLDFRFYSEMPYRQNHAYRKIKKEGVYEIIENHRPVEWYAKTFHQAGLVLLDIILTPPYKIRQEIINDFTIFKLQK